MVVGNAAAAASCRAILCIYQDAVAIKRRIVAESAPVPHLLFVAHSRVPQNERDLIKRVLLATTFQGVPPDLRKAFIYEGRPPFIEVSGDDLGNLKSRIRKVGAGR